MEAASSRPTLASLAETLGVSAATVSNAYNHPERLSAALRSRVLALAREVGYPGPHPAARALRRGQVGALGVLAGEDVAFALSDPAALLFLQGLLSATRESRLALTLIPSYYEDAVDGSAVRNASVDGFVVYSLADDSPLVAAVLERRLPMVFVDEPRVDAVPFVGIDDRLAARMVAQHLIDLHHERFGVVSDRVLADGRTGPVDVARQERASFRVTRERLAGYRDAIVAAGLRWENVIIEEHPTSVSGGRAAAHALLDRDSDITAIIAMSDQLGLGALDAIGERGLSVPTDVSVVGFDDTSNARISPPSLTTVRQPHFAKGAAAGEFFQGGIDVRDTAVLLPTEVVVRDSSGPRRSHALRRSEIQRMRR